MNFTVLSAISSILTAQAASITAALTTQLAPMRARVGAKASIPEVTRPAASTPPLAVKPRRATGDIDAAVEFFEKLHAENRTRADASNGSDAQGDSATSPKPSADGAPSLEDSLGR